MKLVKLIFILTIWHLSSKLYDSLRFEMKRIIKSFSGFRTDLIASLRNPDWLDLIGKGLDTLDKIKAMDFDMTANAYSISLPQDHFDEIQLLRNKPKVISIMSIDGKQTNITYLPQVTPLFRVHKFSRSVLKKFPDSALLGLLTLSSLELIKRQINSESFIIPSILKEAANITSENLNAKLEMLSSLSWDVELFSKAEMEFLQSQPLDVIEKYVIKEILPKIDKDLSPVLSKLIANPEKITIVTKLVRKYVENTAYEFNKSYVGKNYIVDAWAETLPIHETAMKIVENVDKVGLGFQEVMHEWNYALSNVSKLIKGEVKLNNIWRNWSIPKLYIPPPRRDHMLPDHIDAVDSKVNAIDTTAETRSLQSDRIK